MTVTVKIGNQPNNNDFSLKWKIGSCYGPKNIVEYHANSTYFGRCCLRPGLYTLVCKNDIAPYGWGNSFIEILGHRYCDDFVGYKGFRRIVVNGK